MILSEIHEALRALSSVSPAANPGSLCVARKVDDSDVRVLFAVDADGASCVLVCAGKPGTGFPRFHTDGLKCEFRSRATVELDCRTEMLPVLLLRCGMPEDFGDVYAAVVEQVLRIFRIYPRADAWHEVGGLLTRWSDFFRASSPLSESVALGLWGELWTVAAAHDRAAMLASWRGSEGASHDFFCAGKALEVKASRRRGVHHVSHGQATAAVPGTLMSLHVVVDPNGLRLIDLQNQILSSVDDSYPYYEALRRRGADPGAIARHPGRWALVGEPTLYLLRDVPRVLGVQPGISDLTYTVTLDGTNALSAHDSVAALGELGIRTHTW